MMKYCTKCKYKDTQTCGTCDNGNLWEEAKQSHHLIIASIMFGCGMGGILAAIYAFMN